MSNFLMVPIRLDALHLATDQPVLEAAADFSRLPYANDTRDVNGDTAYISEAISRAPFQDENLFLKAGIHLHWALPDALTKATHHDRETIFPLVPNRWLVRRRGENVVEKTWVIESDYLYPDGTGQERGAISFPVTPEPKTHMYCPFRFMGRTVALEAWRVNDLGAEYLDNLTAIGYGDPTFAALYPNCHSVFGFYDADFATEPPRGLQYDVVGWYDSAKKDCLAPDPSGPDEPSTLREFMTKLEKDFQWTLADESIVRLYDQSQQDRIKSYLQKEETVDSAASCLIEAIENNLALEPAVDQTIPARTLYYARLTFQPAGKSVKDYSATPAIIVANTGTEALSTLLAHRLAQGEDADQTEQLNALIEDQLEALSFSARLDGKQLDVGPNFEEARHEKEFTAIPGGTIWTITKAAANISPADASNANMQAQITLPPEIAPALNQVNHLQADFDQALEEIESQRRQLFSDWYKYLLCAYPPDDAMDSYPDMDEVRNFIEVSGIAPLSNKMATTGDLVLKTDPDNDHQIVSSSSLGLPTSLGSQLSTALNNLLNRISKFNDSENVKNAKVIYRLRPKPAARYYQPNNPVVLLTGPAVAATVRHGQDGRWRTDGLLECQLLQDAELESLIPAKLSAITERVDEIQKLNGGNLAFNVWDQPPWNPFLLEWETEVFPIAEQGNVQPDTSGYQSTFIYNTYSLDENQVDFSIRSGKGSLDRAANVYAGCSILTPHASIRTKEQIENYLRKILLPQYYEAQNIPPNQQDDSYFSEHFDQITNWYESSNASTLKSAADKAKDPIETALRAWRALQDLDCLSQSLGGFNESLLMHKQTLQLDIADPLAFEDQQPFVETVRTAVRQSNTCAPQPLSDFNPIRSGALRLTRLRLVDTFGRTRDLDCRDVLTTEKLKLGAAEVTLPPRLTQPARINFRWLSAGGDEQEMNDHPDTSPICGWLLPNNLDNSLMIYDGKGKALGSIDQDAAWETAPGSNIPESISNPHLKKVAIYLSGQGREFVQDFISALDSALENIDPENFAQHQDLALLMGRPIAVVRAAVSLQLKGLPAVHQGWNTFRQDLDRNERDTDDFDKVRFPIRLGEFQQFNDGLVGYWREAGDQYEGNLFYSPQSTPIGDQRIKTHANDPMTIYQSLNSPPQFLTMLIDPRGIVNATSGILPVKSINIPPDQYTDALKAIEITFLSTPVLSEISKLRLPLPTEPGFNWSWLQKEKDGWTEISAGAMVRKQSVLEAFKNGETIWSALIACGWLTQLDRNTASVAARDRRTKANLGGELDAQTDAIESFLDQTQLGPVNQGAVIPGPQRLLEGWLRLSNAQTGDK